MGLAIVLAFIGLFLAGFPVVYAILFPAIVYVLVEDLPLSLLSQRVTYALDSFPLVAVPLFIFVGNLMNQAGIAERIFRFANTLVGRAPGGLAQVNVFGSLVFSGMSGSALADIGGLGRIEIAAMKREGYPVPFAASITASSAIVGPIFPPSIPLIVYGSVTSVSIVQLLIAGIVPALICVALLMITVAIIGARRGYPRAARWSSPREILRDLGPATPAIIAPALMIAGMMLGIFTPTEAAAITVVYVIAISALVYRELTLRHLVDAAIMTVRNTGTVLIIIAAAALYGWILAVEQVPQNFARLILDVSKDPLTLLLLVNLLLFIAGMFLDSTTATLLVVPIIAPPIVAAGVDPVHLGIVAIFNLMIGLLTPPMGLALFLISDIARISMKDLLRAMLPFYLPLLGTLAIITLAEDLTLWLPRMMR
jgi:tripartite ATP-independent transporter DctM subunit